MISAADTLAPLTRLSPNQAGAVGVERGGRTTYQSLAVTRNATEGELAMRCIQTSQGCSSGRVKGRGTQLARQAKVAAVISRGQAAYADGKRQRLQVKPESNCGQGENLSRL